MQFLVFWLHLHYSSILQLRIKLTSQEDARLKAKLQHKSYVTHKAILPKILTFSPTFSPNAYTNARCLAKRENQVKILPSEKQ